MALNEYLITSGGTIFTKADKYAHKMAKFFLSNRGVDLDKVAVLTKRAEIDFRHPIEKMSRIKLSIESTAYNKNGDVYISCLAIDKSTSQVAGVIHLTFSVIPREEINERLVGKRKK